MNLDSTNVYSMTYGSPVLLLIYDFIQLLQRSIFSYTTSRAPQTLEIETVQASQTDESQSEPESDVDMADPLEEEEPQSL